MALFGSKKTIGLDIGSSTIKLAELEVGRSNIKLVSFGVVPTPPGTISGGEILDSNAISEAVQQVVMNVQSRRKHVATGIWGTAVIVKKINLPQMDLHLLDEQIKWEAEQYIPYDIDEINLEYHVLKNSGALEGTMDVLLVAAKKDVIFSYIESIELAGKNCSVLDVSGFALANCFLASYGQLPGEVVALMDIGAGVINFVVLNNNEVVFSRDIPFGGQNYTAEVQKFMAVSLEEAETLKLDFCNNRPAPEQVSDIITNVHDSLSDEIVRSIEFYSATAEEFPIQKAFITGGSSRMTGLKEHIQQTTKLPVEMFDPLAGIHCDKKLLSGNYIQQISSISTVALGLGLRKLGDR